VYALDTTLDPPDSTKPKELIAAITPHIISQAVLTGRFGVFDIFRRG
jgi:PEBP family protein